MRAIIASSSQIFTTAILTTVLVGRRIFVSSKAAPFKSTRMRRAPAAANAMAVALPIPEPAPEIRATPPLMSLWVVVIDIYTFVEKLDSWSLQ